MIEIDGSIGYGQVLRTSIALSALTLEPIKIFNIRKDRPKPGLMPQHLVGVKIAGEFCNAEMKGLELNSTEVEFIPRSFNVTDRKIDIGTAGQISLLLQTLTPLLIFGDKPVTLDITGGTAGLGAPTIEYLKHITFPVISKLGLKQPEVEVVRQGFYPRGGGLVRISIDPVKKLNSVKLTHPGRVEKIKGVSISGSLPEHVATRQAESAKKYLLERNFKDVEINTETVETYSQGTSITLWAECENTILGFDYIGKIGVRAEVIGEECAKGLVRTLKSNSALDKFMSDQILVFLALAKDESKIKVEEITEHCQTNMRVTEQILGVKFNVDEEDRKISIEGIGFSKN
jgi:RNA 3'-phosphate cyclase